jgi:hypothetical protein
MRSSVVRDRRGSFVRGAGVATLAVVVVAAVPRAQAQTCDVTCSLNTSMLPSNIERPGKYIWFSASATSSGSCNSVDGKWDFGDGTSADASQAQHKYTQAGTYTATYSAFERHAPSVVKCTATASVTIVPAACDLVGSGLTVVSNDPATRTVSLRVDGTVTDCGGLAITDTRWEWGDGVYDDWFPGVTGRHTYAGGGRYNAYALSFLGARTSGVKFSNSLWIDVVGRPCLQVGNLTLCGDSLQQNGDSYTLTGNVKINDILAFSGPITYRGNPASGKGDLFTDAALSVATTGKLGPVTILSGKNQYYDVDGSANPPRLSPQYLVPPTELGFRLNGVPVCFLGSVTGTEPINVAANGVLISPTMYVGKAGGFYLGSFRLHLILAPGHPVELSASDLAEVTGAPGIELDPPLQLTYDGAKDMLSGRVDVHFPFLHTWMGAGEEDWSFDLGISGGCIDRLDAGPFAEEDSALLRFGTTNWPLLGVQQMSLANICDAASFAPWVSGPLFFTHGGTTIATDPVPWRYEPTKTIRLAGSPIFFLDREVGTPRGAWLGAKGFDTLLLSGWYGTGGGENDADVIKGALTLGAISASSDAEKWQAYGTLKGTFTAFGGYCDCPPDAGEECTLASTAFEALHLGEGASYGVTFDVTASGTAASGDGTAFFQATNVFPQIPNVGVFVRRDLDSAGNADVTCYLLANLVAPASQSSPEVSARWASPVERSATFSHTEEPAAFGCAGKTGVLPSIYLKTPAGQTITRATVARFPGAGYASDTGTNAAVFAVAAATPGTWTLGVDNLAESDVTCTILTVQQPPQVAFTQVQQTGATVSVALSVTPPAGATRVSLFYSQLADGIPQGEIAADLSAAGGSVGATWDTSALPTGAYFVFARTDDGHNPPITTIHQPAVEVVNGNLLPPTAVHVARTADTATLTWTPSLSSAVVGYSVLYTGAPDAPGYPLSAAAPLPTGATVSGLDRSAVYRFCVVAYDADGNRSPRSNEIVLGPRVRPRHPVTR